MHHARNLSDASNASSQSTMSVISDGFEASVRANMEGPRTNEFLILAAKDHLLFFQAKAERLNPTPSTVDPGIDPARILHAMLEHAVICGPGSQRYTACCIITCDEKVEELVELANTWVRYLLWPCRLFIVFPLYFILTLTQSSAIQIEGPYRVLRLPRPLHTLRKLTL